LFSSPRASVFRITVVVVVSQPSPVFFLRGVTSHFFPFSLYTQVADRQRFYFFSLPPCSFAPAFQQPTCQIGMSHRASLVFSNDSVKDTVFSVLHLMPSPVSLFARFSFFWKPRRLYPPPSDRPFAKGRPARFSIARAFARWPTTERLFVGPSRSAPILSDLSRTPGSRISATRRVTFPEGP